MLDIMICYKNTKVMVRSPDSDIGFFDILTENVQGNTLAPCIFLICTDDLALLAKSHVQAESLLDSLEQLV